MDDGNQREFQTGFSMARGEGASADASALGRGHGPSGPGLARLPASAVALLAVLALLGAGYFLLLDNDTYAEVTSVEVDLDTGAAVLDVAVPDGCWTVATASSVEVFRTAVIVDLQLVPGDPGATAGCTTGDAIPIAVQVMDQDLPATVPVRRVACLDGGLDCSDGLTATIVG